MNYRHAYHAGNFADCLKHALLIAVLRAMQRKPKPLLVLDTHAGAGRYDLTTGPAARTGEWQHGIAAVLAAGAPVLADYTDMVQKLGLYPGSPALTAALLRPHDRLVACELHPEEARLLKANLAGRRQIAVHERDGYAALRAFLPPPERRALILIDPPFEAADEYAQALAALQTGHERFAAGVVMLWYPLKTRTASRDFFETLKYTRIRDVVTMELCLREPVDPLQLNGCGVMVINPPYGFVVEAELILASLRTILGQAGGSSAVRRLIDE